MEHLDNLAIMNYLQGYGLIGGYGTSAGYEKNQGIKDGLAKYRAFIAYEKNNNGASHKEAVEKWKTHKPKHTVKKAPRERKPRLTKKIKSYINEGLSIEEARDLFELSQSKKKKKPTKINSYIKEGLSIDEARNLLELSQSEKKKKKRAIKGDKTLYELHQMRLPQLRKYAKKYIKLSILDKETGKRKQLTKDEIMKKLGFPKNKK
jgi:hypothetical protein